MIVELVRDNRKIVDRITKDQIDQFVDLLRENLVSTSMLNVVLCLLREGPVGVLTV
jgi:hypothetical protein